jgi:UDP-N-acetylglucosamine 2-epimerase (non-hydrolysing)
MKIMIIFGTRPELIKLAPVIRELQKQGKPFEPFILATAQHREMLDQMLRVFGITPDRDLNVMIPNQSLEVLSSNVLLHVSTILDDVRPDLVMIQGDTTTAMISALAAFYKKIAVAHVEAGLRTHEAYNPFPEEINRRIISTVTSFHFPPTAESADNLHREGITAEKILITGNTVVDALHQIDDMGFTPSLAWPFAPQSRVILVTSHRRENFGQPLTDICGALVDISERFTDVEIVYPVHPNPNVRSRVQPLLSGRPRIHLIEPLNYIDLLLLMKRCHFILTDSGGIQEEAPTFGKPVLVLRQTTERPEGITAGVSRLVGTNREKIVAEASHLLSDAGVYQSMVTRKNPYGDGRAASRIVDFLRRQFPA